MVQLIAALLLAIIPQSEVITEAVDVIEINHFHDEQGRKVFDQVLFWDWDEKAARHQIVAWRMLNSESQRPRRTDKIFVAKWRDEQNRDCLRCVYATSFRETWTQHDPELVEREHLPKEKRRGLSKPLREPVIQAGERSILR